MKKSLLTLVVVGFSILGLTGCNNDPTSSSSTSDTPVITDEFIVSGPAEHETFVLAQLKALSESDPTFSKITYKYSVIGEDKTDSITDWSSATSPDIYAYASDKILPLLQTSAIAQVPTDYVNEISSQMGAAALDVATVAGKTYAYPYAGDNGYFLYYDKSAVTADDVSSMEKLLAKAESLNLKVAYPLETAFYNMGALFTYGADYQVNINDEGVVTSIDGDFDGAAGIKGGKAMLKIMTNSAWQNTQATPIAANGLVACIDGGWSASTYSEAMGDNFACAKLPTITIDNDTKTLGSFLGYKLYGVNPQKRLDTTDKTTTHLAYAHRIARYLVSEKVQEARYDALMIAPTNAEVKKLDKVANNAAIAAIADQSQYAHGQGAVPASLWACTNNFVADIKTNSVTEANMATYMAAVNTALTTLGD